MSFCKMIIDSIKGAIDEPQRPSRQEYKKGAKFDRWIDYARDKKDNGERIASMPRRGKYKTRTGFPDGLIIHYTAGNETGPSLASYAKSQGYSFLILDTKGVLWQGAPLDQWGYHAGISSMTYKGKKVSSASKYCVGVEVICRGLLFGIDANNKKIDFSAKPGLIADYDGPLYGWSSFYKSLKLKPNQLPVPYPMTKKFPKSVGNIRAGIYQLYTEAQHEGLLQLIQWLQGVNPDFNIDYVLGHDEVSPGRKTDPGGSLGQSMNEFRSTLRDNMPQNILS